MRLLIKQRVFSWGDTYDIYDENGNAKYLVKAEIFSFGHQLHVYDRAGNEIGAVKQQLFTFMPKFDIEIQGRTIGTISKEFTFFFQKYHVDFNGWNVEGDFMNWEYQVTNYSGSQVAHISKEWLTWGDTYTIDIANPSDELTAMMLVVAIDAANCENK